MISTFIDTLLDYVLDSSSQIKSNLFFRNSNFFFDYVNTCDPPTRRNWQVSTVVVVICARRRK